MDYILNDRIVSPEHFGKSSMSCHYVVTLRMSLGHGQIKGNEYGAERDGIPEQVVYAFEQQLRAISPLPSTKDGRETNSDIQISL